MKKSTKWIQWVVGVIVILFLLITDFTPNIKSIIIGGIVLYLFFFEQVKKGNKTTPSYKLDISIEPRWFLLYKATADKKTDEALIKEIETKEKNSEDIDANLYNRNYHFIEYYNSNTGLITRLQKILLPSGRQICYPVDEFGNRGYFFASDKFSKESHNENEKKGRQREKLSVKIDEDSIRSDIYGLYPGPDIEYKEGNILFQLPLHDIFNFLLALGQRFHEAENKTIVKWPDHIEEKFKKLGITYETYFDNEPTLFDIEEYDKKFFEKWGRPKIALHSDNLNFGYLKSEKDGTYFDVKLKIFRPGENYRIAIEN